VLLVLGTPIIAFGAGNESERDRGDIRSQVVMRKAVLMGTEATLVCYTDTRSQGLEYLEAIIQVIARSENELSTWRLSSDLSELNNTPVHKSVSVPPKLCHLLGILDSWNTRTGGSFDPGIGRLIDTWDLRGNGRVPHETELSAAFDNSGLDKFRISGCQVERTRDAKLDAGAFGKGVALKEAMANSVGKGATPWMISFGGQVCVYGRPPASDGWPVELAELYKPSRSQVRLKLEKGSIATSSGLYRDRWVNGTRVGHIIDPRTGRPAVFSGSVTVWDEDPLVADILSTALYVMGPAEGLEWADREGVAAFFQVPTPGGEVVAMTSERFREEFF
jgi:thiamine biosynthesis lipoprotein